MSCTTRAHKPARRWRGRDGGLYSGKWKLVWTGKSTPVVGRRLGDWIGWNRRAIAMYPDSDRHPATSRSAEARTDRSSSCAALKRYATEYPPTQPSHPLSHSIPRVLYILPSLREQVDSPQSRLKGPSVSTPPVTLTAAQRLATTAFSPISTQEELAQPRLRSRQKQCGRQRRFHLKSIGREIGVAGGGGMDVQEISDAMHG